jgi:hypothetical protein
MAIFVKDVGVKVTVRSSMPEGASKFAQYATDDAFVAELASIAQEDSKFDYMLKVWNKTGRLVLKGNNGMAARVRAAAKGTQELAVASEGPSIEEIMAEAEVENAKRDASSISDKRMKAIQAELSKAGLSVAGL